MKGTRTVLKVGVGGDFTTKDGRAMKRYQMEFDLADEDFEIVAKLVLPRLPNADISDAMLAMLTYGIHKAYEDVEGTEFVLPMDRDKPTA